MVWLPGGEKILKICFFHFDRIHERDRQTHRHCMATQAALA